MLRAWYTAIFAARFCVSVAFIGKLLRRQRQTGQLAALPGRGGPARCLDAARQAWPGERVAAQPDVTLAELQALLRVARGQLVSRGSVWRVLDEQGWQRKKACTPLSATHHGYTPCAASTSRPSRKAPTWPAFIFWTKRSCG